MSHHKMQSIIQFDNSLNGLPLRFYSPLYVHVYCNLCTTDVPKTTVVSDIHARIERPDVLRIQARKLWLHVMGNKKVFQKETN